jgi:uncharacterized protein YozE (UPF0346 family)
LCNDKRWTSILVYNKITFKEWIIKEYLKINNEFGELAREIYWRWPNFPDEGTYLGLAIWLENHGACYRCLKSFKDAWDMYISDINA